MDPSVVARLHQLRQLADAGVISAAALEATQQKVLDGALGLPVTSFTTVHSGAPLSVVSSLFGGAAVPNGVAPPQLQNQAPQLALAPPPTLTGPTAQQLAAQQQLESLQQQQAAQMEQMQQQMQQQMDAAQAAIAAATPAPVAAPQVQFREQPKAATRSTSSGEKPAAAAVAAAPAAAAPKNKVSEKQSTDLGSKAKGSSGGTEKRAIVVRSPPPRSPPRSSPRSSTCSSSC